MIFIYCIWVSTRWQLSVNLYKNRKEAAIYKRRNNTQSNIKTQKTENKHTEQENEHCPKYVPKIRRYYKCRQFAEESGKGLRYKETLERRFETSIDISCRS
jgi:hypothetical protein